MSDQNPNDSNSNNPTLLEQARMQAKKNPALVAIAAVLVAMFLFAFIPVIPERCTIGDCTYGNYKRWNQTCKFCNNRGTAFMTVWKYVNR